MSVDYSIENLLDQMWSDQEAADKAVEDWQSTLKAGDYVVRQGPDDVLIFCQILNPAKPVDEGEYSQEHLDELKEQAKWYKEPHMKHFRFCRAFSIYCPNGELGDVHLSTVVRKITKAEFTSAKEQQWRTPKKAK